MGPKVEAARLRAGDRQTGADRFARTERRCSKARLARRFGPTRSSPQVAGSGSELEGAGVIEHDAQIAWCDRVEGQGAVTARVGCMWRVVRRTSMLAR